MADKDKNDKNEEKDAKDPKDHTTTTIGPTIVIRGRVKSDEDLIVKGRIEAEISSSKAVQIENSGIVKANLQVKSAKISGVLVGNIQAESRVELSPDGRMVGDILAPRIVISDGAAFKGRIDMQSFDTPKTEREMKAAEAAQAQAKPPATPPPPPGRPGKQTIPPPIAAASDPHK
jgi:cytoskeletal protein CcmA (bactofilin family)